MFGLRGTVLSVLIAYVCLLAVPMDTDAQGIQIGLPPKDFADLPTCDSSLADTTMAKQVVKDDDGTGAHCNGDGADFALCVCDGSNWVRVSSGAGVGAMLESTYDANANQSVDKAECIDSDGDGNCEIKSLSGSSTIFFDPDDSDDTSPDGIATSARVRWGRLCVGASDPGTCLDVDANGDLYHDTDGDGVQDPGEYGINGGGLPSICNRATCVRVSDGYYGAADGEICGDLQAAWNDHQADGYSENVVFLPPVPGTYSCSRPAAFCGGTATNDTENVCDGDQTTSPAIGFAGRWGAVTIEPTETGFDYLKAVGPDDGAGEERKIALLFGDADDGIGDQLRFFHWMEDPLTFNVPEAAYQATVNQAPSIVYLDGVDGMGSGRFFVASTENCTTCLEVLSGAEYRGTYGLRFDVRSLMVRAETEEHVRFIDGLNDGYGSSIDGYARHFVAERLRDFDILPTFTRIGGSKFASDYGSQRWQDFIRIYEPSNVFLEPKLTNLLAILYAYENTTQPQSATFGPKTSVRCSASQSIDGVPAVADTKGCMMLYSCNGNASPELSVSGFWYRPEGPDAESSIYAVNLNCTGDTDTGGDVNPAYLHVASGTRQQYDATGGHFGPMAVAQRLTDTDLYDTGEGGFLTFDREELVEFRIGAADPTANGKCLAIDGGLATCGSPQTKVIGFGNSADAQAQPLLKYAGLFNTTLLDDHGSTCEVRLDVNGSPKECGAISGGANDDRCSPTVGDAALDEAGETKPYAVNEALFAGDYLEFRLIGTGCNSLDWWQGTLHVGLYDIGPGAP